MHPSAGMYARLRIEKLVLSHEFSWLRKRQSTCKFVVKGEVGDEEEGGVEDQEEELEDLRETA
jgi:hypothetical protein